MGLNDAGQASFKICDLKLNNILGEIDYNTNSSLRIAVLRNFFAEKKYDNEILKVWMDKAQAKINFNQAIANISAHSLALMKVNSLKNN